MIQLAHAARERRLRAQGAGAAAPADAPPVDRAALERDEDERKDRALAQHVEEEQNAEAAARLSYHDILAEKAAARAKGAKLDIKNLHKLAVTQQKGKVDGSKVPHEAMTFRCGDDDDEFKVTADDWVNKKKRDVVGPGLEAGVLVRQDVRRTVEKWDGRTDLVAGIVGKHLLTKGTGDAWLDPKESNDEYIGLQLQRGISMEDPASRDLVLHLLNVRAALHWREDTMKALNLDTIQLKGKGAPPGSVKLDWGAFWKNARDDVKRRLLGDGLSIPELPATKDERVFDEIFLAAAKRTPGFDALEKFGALGDSRYRQSIVDKSKADKGDALWDALRHVRFALYMDWRAGHELLYGAASPDDGERKYTEGGKYKPADPNQGSGPGGGAK